MSFPSYPFANWAKALLPQIISCGLTYLMLLHYCCTPKSLLFAVCLGRHPCNKTPSLEQQPKRTPGDQQAVRTIFVSHSASRRVEPMSGFPQQFHWPYLLPAAPIPSCPSGLDVTTQLRRSTEGAQGSSSSCRR